MLGPRLPSSSSRVSLCGYWFESCDYLCILSLPFSWSSCTHLTIKLIFQCVCADKYVRENDENWTSKQSAACVKSGDGISTFRDKYGES